MRFAHDFSKPEINKNQKPWVKHSTHLTSVHSLIQRQPIYQLQSFSWSQTGNPEIVKEGWPHSNAWGKQSEIPEKLDITSHNKWLTGRRIVSSRPRKTCWQCRLQQSIAAAKHGNTVVRPKKHTIKIIPSQHRKQIELNALISNTVTSHLRMITLAMISSFNTKINCSKGPFEAFRLGVKQHTKWVQRVTYEV